jgi:hypothetical protein
MTHGYIYVLTNQVMPGLVKIGRTERDPVQRAKELRTTGVPAPFELVYSCLVSDCEETEKNIHILLSKRGVRHSPDREFFEVSCDEAIELIQLVTEHSESICPDFSLGTTLSELAAAIRVPEGTDAIEYESAVDIAYRLAEIARKGYPYALKMVIAIFEVNCPTTIKFREFYREYLELARDEAKARPIMSGGSRMRIAIGKEAVEYLERLHRRGWLVELDFEYIGELLVSGDRFIYEGYIAELKRSILPPHLLQKAENL